MSDRAWRDYTRAFRRDVFPHLVSSAYMIHVGETANASSPDLRAATELGLMLLLGKPLVLVVPIGETVPAALLRAADVVIDDADMNDPATQDRIVDAFRKLGALDG